MKRTVVACLLAAASTVLATNSASAQLLGQPGYGGGGLPLVDSPGTYRRSTIRYTPRYTPSRRRTNTGSNWTNRGYTAPVRTGTRTTLYRAPTVQKRWQVYTTAFTRGDADSVVSALKRSGYYTYPRSRIIPYRPYSRTVYDVMIWR